MDTSTGTIKGGRPSSSGKSSTPIQIIETEVKNLITQHFSGTLGPIPDIIKLVLACIYTESRFSTSANSGLHSEWHFEKFKKYPPIAAKYAANSTSDQEKANMRNSVAGFGLMQATGWYLTKGAGPGGKNEMMRMRPDLAPPLLLEPGMDINDKLGPGQMTNQLLAGLIILEAKYKASASQVSTNPTKDKPYTDRVVATFGGFAGKGEDKFGTNAVKYALSIVKGESYKIVSNGYTSPGVNTGNTKTGPVKTIASGTNPDTAGCCSTA